MEKPPRVVPKPISKPGMPPKGAPKVPSSAPVGKPGAAAAPKPVAATVGRPAWYKRKYLVYPKFQMTLILLNSLVTIVLFGLVAYLVMKSHLYLETVVKQTRLPAQQLFIQLMTEQLRHLLFYMFLALGIAIATTAIFTLLISHKMAGPMVRMKGFFNQIIRSGSFPDQLRFRDGDFFQDLPPTVNDALLALKKRWQK